MIALGIRYLTGRCVAADASQRAPEWPPHPARVFMAMAAAHFETEEPDAAERTALRWLECQEPPAVEAPPGDAGRSFVETYVPANDQKGGAALANRARTARSFASLYVGDNPVVLRWPEEPTPEVRQALAGLCSRVTRIGHSSSLVQMWLAGDESKTEAWEPVGFAAKGQNLRVAGMGTLQQLEESFAAGQRPQVSSWQAYRQPRAEGEVAAVGGPFDPNLIVFRRIEGPALGLETTLQLTGALRNAAMRAVVGRQPPEWLTGHSEAGTPSSHVHAAFFPLPHVGSEHADGHVLGLAMALPRGLDDDELRPVLEPLLFSDGGQDREIHLWCGRGEHKFWKWMVKREIDAYPAWNLRSTRWTGPAKNWASVTPVVLHHYPKPNRAGDLERIVREAFRSALLPDPQEVRTGPASLLEGAGHARAVPAYDEGGQGLCRYQCHVCVRFDQPIEGPVLMGRGRFRGYGLFAPVSQRDGSPQ